MVDIERAFKSVMKEGKVTIGLKKTKKMLIEGKAKMIVVARNCPEKEKIKELAREKNVPVFEFSGKGVELGPVCGKPFSISTFAVLDEGKTDILSIVGES